jgi:hypothetical protein
LQLQTTNRWKKMSENDGESENNEREMMEEDE